MALTAKEFNTLNDPTIFPCLNHVRNILKELMGNEKWEEKIGNPDFMFESTERYELKQEIRGEIYTRQISICSVRKSHDVKITFVTKKGDREYAKSIYDLPHINDGTCILLFAKCAEAQFETFDMLTELEMPKSDATQSHKRERSK